MQQFQETRKNEILKKINALGIPEAKKKEMINNLTKLSAEEYEKLYSKSLGGGKSK